MFKRFKKLLTFISFFKVEPLMVLSVATSTFLGIPLEVLIEDKLCRNTYNMSEKFCSHLPYMRDNELNHEIKTQILSDTVHFNMYRTFISTTPAILWSIFLGAWTDKYIGGRKAIFIISSLMASVQSAINLYNSYYFYSNINWVLVSYIPNAFSGSMTLTVAYSYVAVTTPATFRTIRMAILEILIAISQPMIVLLSRKLLSMDPIWSTGEIHNCSLIFILCSGCAFGAFLWTIIIIDQQNDMNLFEKYFNNQNQQKQRLISISTDIKFKLNQNKTERYRHPLRLLFDIKHFKYLVITAFKKRSDYRRAQIWLVFGAMFCSYFISNGPLSYIFEFVETTYNWDSTMFNGIRSLGMIVNSIILMIITPLLIKVFNLNDMFLSIIGFCGSFLYLLILGLILSPIGYYIGLAFNCTNSLGTIGYRTHLSKIVDPKELGKVFTLMAVIDGLAPIIASAVFTVIFEKTIETNPGTSFIILAAIAIIPIFIAISIDYISLREMIKDKESQTIATHL